MLNADGVGYYRSMVDPAMAHTLLTPSTAIARARGDGRRPSA